MAQANIVPLEPSTTKDILAALGGVVPKSIIHIQIEKKRCARIRGYDDFHPECIYFGKAVHKAVIDSLISEAVMRPYGQRRSERSSL